MQKLEQLKLLGLIVDYKITDLDDEGNPGESPHGRNTQRLELLFPNGDSLVVDTFCSGCNENTSLECS